MCVRNVALQKATTFSQLSSMWEYKSYMCRFFLSTIVKNRVPVCMPSLFVCVRPNSTLHEYFGRISRGWVGQNMCSCSFLFHVLILCGLKVWPAQGRGGGRMCRKSEKCLSIKNRATLSNINAVGPDTRSNMTNLTAWPYWQLLALLMSVHESRTAGQIKWFGLVWFGFWQERRIKIALQLLIFSLSVQICP